MDRIPLVQSTNIDDHQLFPCQKYKNKLSIDEAKTEDSNFTYNRSSLVRMVAIVATPVVLAGATEEQAFGVDTFNCHKQYNFGCMERV